VTDERVGRREAVRGLERPVVLLVDDDHRNLALARAHLEAEYDVLEARSGPEALAICGARNVDLVVLDLMMPGMDGFEVCRALKERGSRDFLPVLLVTASAEPEDRHRGLEAGADDFLGKPVNRQELRLRVRNFVTMRRHQQLLLAQYEELRSLSELKDDLVTLMVHDLRNPLTGVLGLLHILELDVEDPQLRADVEAARASAEKLRETLDDMLQVRLLEEGRLELSRSSEEVASLVGAAIASVEGAARLARLELLQALSPGLIVNGDCRLLRRAIENLLTNAIKFSPAGESIGVETQLAPGRLEIRVVDRGRAVPPESRDRLFDKFGGTLAQRPSDRRGYGLGLYFVRLVAEAHGGRVSVAEREGGGTIMSLSLPQSAAAQG
jgi:two-component system sensor histidine kinase/response regulator